MGVATDRVNPRFWWGRARAMLAHWDMDVYLEPLAVRRYGSYGPAVIVLHGGPGAPGSTAPLCRELDDMFRVFEPLQRTSDHGVITVQRHVDDLHDVVLSCCPDSPPALVGHSWGAMLALAYAAQHPESVACVVLVGCGTFDVQARSALEATLKSRAAPEFQRKLARVTRDITDPDVRLCVLARVLDPLYTCDGVAVEDETEEYDSRGHDQTWNDMLRLQESGQYPQSFDAIRIPVLMLHGAWDPHPGRMTFETLSEYMPHLQYVELRDCGHYPWKERLARDGFHSRLRSWLASHVT